ncbi:MAG: hypothetical protein QOK23_453 [Gammaproteobacteria bacterium]|nr:hypothetical protein [Gammaproteobacteria bacterium]
MRATFFRLLFLTERYASPQYFLSAIVRQPPLFYC